MANTDRTALRKALGYHTDGKLTNSTDQDFYLNKAEQDVFGEWRKFDPGLFRPALETVTCDASGIILLEQNFSKLEYLEDTNHRQFFILPYMSTIPWATGYIFLGFDQSTSKRKIQIFANGSPLANGTSLNWYNIERLMMTSDSASESAIPEEHRNLISIRAAFLYYRDKGPAFSQFKDSWGGEFERELSKAKEWYKNISKDAQFVQSYDPDSGTNIPRLQQMIP